MNNSKFNKSHETNISRFFIITRYQQLFDITTDQLTHDLIKTTISIMLKIAFFINIFITLSISHSVIIGEERPIILIFHIIKVAIIFSTSISLIKINQHLKSIIVVIMFYMIDLYFSIIYTQNISIFAIIIPIICMPSITMPKKFIILLMSIFTMGFFIVIMISPSLQKTHWLTTPLFSWAALICFIAVGQGLQGVLREYIKTREAHELEAVQRARIEEHNRLLVEHNDRLLFAQHDLRGPCNTVLGAIEILQTIDLDEPTQHHLIQQLEPVALQLRSRIDALFDQAKTPLLASQLELPLLDLPQTIQEHLPELRRMTSLLAPGAEQSTSVTSTGEQSIAIRARLPEIQRILENLVINAAGVGATDIRIATGSRGGQAALTISDNGPGFPGWMLEQPLRPMVSGRTHGTGLGLAGTVANVQAFGGVLELSNTAIGGRVDIRFPQANGAGSQRAGEGDATKLQPTGAL